MAYSYVRYTGNGSTTNYTFPFPYISQEHVKVRVDGVLTTLFSFLNENTVQFFSAPAEGVVIDIRRETPKDSPIVDFTDGSVLLERDLDLIAQFNLYTSQEAADLSEDSMILDSTGRWDAESKRIGNLAAPVNDDEAVNKGTLVYEYPAVQVVAGSVSSLNIVASDLGQATSLSTDFGLITDPATTVPGAGSSKIVTVADNIADVNAIAENLTTIQNAETNATSAAASASSASTSATSAATSATAAASSATSASASATTATSAKNDAQTYSSNAATSAAQAASSATAAAGSATTATTQAGNAATSASAASSSATAAASSATSAAASAASAATLLDNFDDRYLGPKASAPTVDNDGDPLVIGALYFDTTTNKMRTYTSSGWVDPSSASVASLTKYKYTATAGQTTFNGVDANGLTLSYIVGGEIVALNGVVLVGAGDDYTGSTGTSIVLTSGASAGDVIEVYAFSSFSIASVDGSAITNGTITSDKFANLDFGTI